MSEAPTLEKRVETLEAEFAELKRQLKARGVTSGSWLDRVTGSFRDEPDFEEVLRLGRDYRRSHRPEAEA